MQVFFRRTRDCLVVACKIKSLCPLSLICLAKEFSGEVHIADAADIATWFVSETKSGLWGHYADAKIVTLDETAANLANLNLEGDIEQIKRRQRVRPGTFLHWMIQHEEGKKEQERKGRGG